MGKDQEVAGVLAQLTALLDGLEENVGALAGILTSPLSGPEPVSEEAT